MTVAGTPRRILLVTLFLVVAAAGCSKDSSRAATSHTVAPAPTPPVSAPPEPSWAVGTRAETFVDTTRPTEDPTFGTDPSTAGIAQPTRTLPTAVFYPSESAPSPRIQENAPAAQTGRPFPLVIFAHGHTVSNPARAYSGLLRAWAAAGYVVAVPTFPVSSTKLTGSIGDVVNQPADVRFVINQLLDLSARPDGPYAGLIDPAHLAVAGHSLGAMTALAFSLNSCCDDERIRAVVALAGAERSFPGGQPARGDGHVATMVVHGDADATVRYSDGRKAFDDAVPPKAMLTLIGADHSLPFGGGTNPPARMVTAATLAFLDHFVKGVDGLDALRVAASGDQARLDVREK